jgi:hypothetical protein
VQKQRRWLGLQKGTGVVETQDDANLLRLDGELRRLEGGGRGSWDGERAAALVNRMTQLAPVSFASDAAYYWTATREQCLEEAEELREELEELPADADSLPHVRSLKEEIKRVGEHGRRAGIIRDLFLEAMRTYSPPPSK